MRLCAQSPPAPTDMFKQLDDAIVGDALIVSGKQLFVDDHVIAEMSANLRKTLNQPVKHPNNPLVVPDKPWEGNLGYSSVIYDAEEGFYKMWYAAWSADDKQQGLCYATSPDGITWRKHITQPWGSKEKNNIVFGMTPSFNCAGVFKDPHDPDDSRRYKMMYSDYPDGTAASASTSVAYSPDGIHWVPEPKNPQIPFSDAHDCPFWDTRLGRYVAILRYGPPNDRIISRIESEDFVRWSPKVTILRPMALDRPFNTILYQMEVMPYDDGRAYFGFISTYHNETIQPIPENEIAWTDKLDVQLAYSRNGVTWHRVVEPGLLADARAEKLNRSPETWKQYQEEAVFIPFGEHGKDWDWGAIYPLQGPIVVGDEIRIYYAGNTGRHWGSYHGDEYRTSGIGLATLRLDGFVSLDAGEDEGMLTTKPLVFIGDAIEVNADATGGSIQVEALGPDGQVIDGYSRADCTPITSDGVRHIVKWKDSGDGGDVNLLQARPIRLKFYMRNAKLFSFTPRVLHSHFIPADQ